MVAVPPAAGMSKALNDLRACRDEAVQRVESINALIAAIESPRAPLLSEVSELAVNVDHIVAVHPLDIEVGATVYLSTSTEFKVRDDFGVLTARLVGD